ISSDEIGSFKCTRDQGTLEWKLSNYSGIGTLDYSPRIMHIRDAINPLPMRTLYKRTLFIGPGGIGKTHFVESKPRDYVLLTEPSHRQCDSHASKKTIAVVTEASYTYSNLHPTLREKMRQEKAFVFRKRYPLVFMDEIFNATPEAVKLAIDIATKDNSLLWLAGDPCQISQCSVDYLKSLGYHIVDVQRDPITPARHTYTDGNFLDTMIREQKPEDAIKNAIDSGRFTIINDIASIANYPSVPIVSGLHNSVIMFNRYIRDNINHDLFIKVKKI